MAGRQTLLTFFAVITAAGIFAVAFSLGQSRTTQREEGRVTVLAKMVEKDEYFLYRTDTAEQKSPQDLAGEEKEKEERSWQMLERTEIYQNIPNPPPPPKEPMRRK